MKLNVVLCLTFVSYVLALPRYPPVVTTQPAKDVAGGWYGNILLLTSETIARSIAPFILNSIALSSTLDAFCASGSFFDSDTMSCQPIGITSLLSVRPDGRVECQAGHFWFGPKQTCIGRKDLWTVPPAGYYCPENWVFSAKESCCVPRTPAAIASYSCGNGNGTWDLVRIACIDRSFTTAD